MSRYIDADKLMLHLNDYKLQVSPSWKDDWEKMVSCLVIDTCMEAVKEQPTADVVEVVRCKDCKYLDKGENDSESWCECTAHFGKYFDVNENDYCSYGEKQVTGKLKNSEDSTLSTR